MRQYRQLTMDDRIDIYALRQAGNSKAAIARMLGVHPSTIGREVARNTGRKGYRPRQAHTRALERRHGARKAVKMTPGTITFIEARLREEHAPEQISGRMKEDPHYKGLVVSHERIYQHVWQDKRNGGDLYLYLRTGHRKKRKRYGKRDCRGQIPNRTNIKDRPAIVARKGRLGDWEADTIIGAHHRGALVSMVERKSQYLLLGHVPQRTAQAVTAQLVQRLSPHRPHVHTITNDNGSEFAYHESTARQLETKIYFADPFCSQQRGLNEQVNGLIRQYWPKKSDLRHINEAQLQFVMDRLNHRPRKSLGFKTPHEVFCNNSKFKPPRVALVS